MVFFHITPSEYIPPLSFDFAAVYISHELLNTDYGVFSSLI